MPERQSRGGAAEAAFSGLLRPCIASNTLFSKGGAGREGEGGGGRGVRAGETAIRSIFPFLFIVQSIFFIVAEENKAVNRWRCSEVLNKDVDVDQSSG